MPPLLSPVAAGDWCKFLLQLVILHYYNNWNFPTCQYIFWNFPNIFGGEYAIINRILTLMAESNITAKCLTTELELSNSSITDWKKGKAKPSTDAIIKIANFFGVSTDFLLTGKESVTNYNEADQEWLSLIHQLPAEAQCEFRGEIKGYIKRLNEESVATDAPLGKTGTDNLGK